MVALLLFGICVGGICKLLVATKQVSDQARDHYVAVNIAKNRVERARAFDYDQLHLFEEDGVVVGVDGTADADGRYRRKTQILTNALEMVEMVVTIAIRNRHTLEFGEEAEMLRTYIADMKGPPEDE
jgi:hypothetical protein